MFKMLMYGALGLALAGVGVNVIDKPWQFFVILAIVVAIDMSSSIHA